MHALNGIPIYESRHLVIRTLVRLPRRRRKKNMLMKKWRKRSRNWGVKPDPSYYFMADPFTGQRSIHCHPDTARRLREALS